MGGGGRDVHGELADRTGWLLMASLPPVRTREEAEQDAEFIRGCLMEAGRPDLADTVDLCGSRGGWAVSFPGVAKEDREPGPLLHRALSLRFPGFPCFACWDAWDSPGSSGLLDCDHVLVAPRGVA